MFIKFCHWTVPWVNSIHCTYSQVISIKFLLMLSIHKCPGLVQSPERSMTVLIRNGLQVMTSLLYQRVWTFHRSKLPPSLQMNVVHYLLLLSPWFYWPPTIQPPYITWTHSHPTHLKPGDGDSKFLLNTGCYEHEVTMTNYKSPHSVTVCSFCTLHLS